MTFSQLHERIENLSAALYYSIGLRKGDVVSCYLDRCIEGVYILYALMRCGLTMTPCMPSHTPGTFHNYSLFLFHTAHLSLLCNKFMKSRSGLHDDSFSLMLH